MERTSPYTDQSFWTNLNVSSAATAKSRLVGQNYGDNQTGHIDTKAPTDQRLTQHLIFPLASYVDDLSLYTRHITQKYIWWIKVLECEVYIWATEAHELINQLYNKDDQTVLWNTGIRPALTSDVLGSPCQYAQHDAVASGSVPFVSNRLYLAVYHGNTPGR